MAIAHKLRKVTTVREYIRTGVRLIDMALGGLCNAEGKRGQNSESIRSMHLNRR